MRVFRERRLSSGSSRVSVPELIIALVMTAAVPWEEKASLLFGKEVAIVSLAKSHC